MWHNVALNEVTCWICQLQACLQDWQIQGARDQIAFSDELG